MIRKTLLAGLFALIVLACGSQDPVIWPEPHDAATASGVGGATSSVASASAAVGTGGSGGAGGSSGVGGANEGGAGPGAPPDESGTRLKARRYVTDP